MSGSSSPWVPPPELPSFAVQRLRARQIAAPEQDAGEIVLSLERVRMLVAETLAPDLEHALESGLRFVVTPEPPLRGGQRAHRRHRAQVALAELAPQRVERAAVQWLGAVVEAESVVGVADGLLEPSLHDRLGGELGAHALGAAVEHLAGSDGVAARIAGVGLGEDVDQELGDAPGGRRLAVGAHHADGGADHRGQQSGERDGARAHHQPVPADEAASAVDRARRARHHRLARQVAPDVVGELRRRAVAALAVLLDRLEHDPVEIAAQASHQLGRVGRARAGDLGRLPTERGEAGRGARRLALADEPAHLVGRRAVEGLLRQRAHAGEELVEHHAERVDVGAGVDVAADVGLLRRHVGGRADPTADHGVQRAIGERLRDRLGDAEVDDLGHRLAVALGDQHVRGLEVAMEDAAPVRVLDAVADLHEELEPLARPPAGARRSSA